MIIEQEFVSSARVQSDNWSLLVTRAGVCFLLRLRGVVGAVRYSVLSFESGRILEREMLRRVIIRRFKTHVLHS